ncbi:MAG: tetratricopeptide repeat protein [Gammaproteobacteria bacterium]|nr:tetratricopeptide repeat protein [Gammaproteobacteria bacterium]
MAGKRKKNRNSRASRAKSQAGLSPQQREALAGELLQTGKYREAVIAFKELLKQERRPDLTQSLAEAYAGRARSLAAKGMFKEAAVIWRNRAESCDRFLAEPAYIELLFQSGEIEPACQLLREQREQIEKRGHLPWLRVFCAVQALAGQEGLLDLFPEEDDPLHRDFPAALAALAAYCSGRDDEMERQLKAIPFRSPFRDFRQILKALSILDNDNTGAEALLDHVDGASPFHALSAAIKSSQAPDLEFLRRYQSMGKAERRFAATLKGWSAQQLDLAQELHQLGEQLATDRFLRFLLRHREELGEEYVRQIAMRILVSYPRGEAACTKSLGQLPWFHHYRIKALRAEADGLPCYDVEKHWYEACIALDDPELLQNSENALILALTLRHMTRHWLRTEPPDGPIFAALERALECDPDHRPSHLELIRLYRQEHRLKDARRVLDGALARYPEDAEVLTEAVQTAIASNAYKKAARLARQVLELDPMNPRVRDILMNSHLAHARKQIRQKKLPLARKELEQALDWAGSEQARGRIDIVLGILELDCGDKDAAHPCFLAGFERTGGGLLGHFYLLMEAGRMGRSMATVVKLARLPKLPRKGSRKQILALIPALGEPAEDNEDIVAGAVKQLQAPLDRAAGLDFSKAEMEHLCEIWLRVGHGGLRSRYASAALKRWPGTPLFVFHQIDARNNCFVPMSPKERQSLDGALETARAEGDMRSVHRIGQLLAGGSPFGYADDDEPFDPFDIDEGPEWLPDELDLQQMIDMFMESLGPAEVAEMRRAMGSEGLQQLLEKMLQGDFNPTLLDAISDDLLPPQTGNSPRKPRKKVTPHDPDQFDLF